MLISLISFFILFSILRTLPSTHMLANAVTYLSLVSLLYRILRFRFWADRMLLFAHICHLMLFREALMPKPLQQLLNPSDGALRNDTFVYALKYT